MAQASHVLAAHVALKAQRGRREGRRRGSGEERRSSNVSRLIFQLQCRHRLKRKHFITRKTFQKEMFLHVHLDLSPSECRYCS